MRLFKKSIALMMTAVMIATMTPISAEAATKKGTVKSITIKNLETKTLVLKKGKTFKLKAKVEVKGKASKKVIYSSSDKKVATVSKSGKIKAVKKGTAKITVKSVANEKKKTTITVKVGTPIKKVKLNESKITAKAGDKIQLKATFSPKKPTVKKVTWSSDKESVATVDKKGVVTCIGEGSVNITATAADGSGKKAVCKIMVESNSDATTQATEVPGTTQATEATTADSGSDVPKPEKPAEVDVAMGDDLSYAGYTLEWSDEFDGTKLDRDSWNVELHDPGWVNKEWQAYVDSEENIYLKDGKLVLKPIKKDNGDGTYSYTSGRVNTQNKKTYTYGMFEVKAKVPEGKGYLPAFWLMANDENLYGQWPRCGEIDIMEVHGSDTDTSYGTIHYGNPHYQNQGTYTLNKGNFSEQYHVFTCEWEPGKITWYVDGNQFYETSDWFSATEGGGEVAYPAPFDQPFYIILNLAVGGEWVGYPDETTNFENASYEIDYVRVYQKESYDENVTKPEKEVILRDPDKNGNYVNNGDFSVSEDLEAAQDWQFATALDGEATAVIAQDENMEGNAVAIETVNDGTADYSVQLMQAGIPMAKGGVYELSFDAYASEERTMSVAVKAPDKNYMEYMSSKTVSMTTEKDTYTYQFTMTNDDDANGRLEFNMGATGSTADVVIDNVVIRKTGVDESVFEEKEKTARADGNYIYNGQFQEGNKRLGDWEIPEGVDASVTSLSDGRRLKVVVTDDTPVTISQKSVPVTAEGQFALSMDAELPEDGNVIVGFLGESYQVVPENGMYEVKFTTPAVMEDKTFTITFSGVGTYYIDNVRIDEDALIKNGLFNAAFSGFEPYVYAGDMASYGIDSLTYDNAAAFDINKTGDQAWYIQLKQNGVELEEGQWYRLSLDAKSTVDRKLMFAIQRDGSKHNDDWTPYSKEEKADLTAEWQTFHTEFQMTYDTDLESVLSISMGAVGGVAVNERHSIYLDNIMLEKIEAPEVEEIPEGENQLQLAAIENTSSDNSSNGFEIDGENMVFTINNIGAQDNAAQITHRGIQLETGCFYRLSFKVKTDVAKKISVNLMDSDYNQWFAGAGSENVEAGEDFTTLTYTFNMYDENGNPRPTMDDALFFISMGKLADESITDPVQMTFTDFELVKVQAQ